MRQSITITVARLDQPPGQLVSTARVCRQDHRDAGLRPRKCRAQTPDCHSRSSILTFSRRSRVQIAVAAQPVSPFPFCMRLGEIGLVFPAESAFYASQDSRDHNDIGDRGSRLPTMNPWAVKGYSLPATRSLALTHVDLHRVSTLARGCLERSQAPASGVRVSLRYTTDELARVAWFLGVLSLKDCYFSPSPLQAVERLLQTLDMLPVHLGGSRTALHKPLPPIRTSRMLLPAEFLRPRWTTPRSI